MLYKDMDDEDAERLLADMVPQDDLMFVLSNKQKVNGAAALLDKDIMQKIVEKFGEDFYILPSSVHECIIVSADADMDTSQLTAASSGFRGIKQSSLPPISMPFGYYSTVVEYYSPYG